MYIVVAVATHTEGFTTLAGLVPGFLLHAGAMFIGVTLLGLASRSSRVGVGRQA